MTRAYLTFHLEQELDFFTSSYLRFYRSSLDDGARSPPWGPYVVGDSRPEAAERSKEPREIRIITLCLWPREPSSNRS